MMKILFATSNQGKMDEIRMIMKDMDAEIISLRESGIHVDIVEDGETFEENAIIKVKALKPYVDEETIILADDSGLVIDALNGEPGVYSARYMGEDTSYTIKNANLIERMKGFEGDERSARFVCVIAAYLPNGDIRTAIGYYEGVIAEEPAGCGGFGYDPILYLPERGVTSAELSAEEKNAISHRGKALTQMKEILKEYQGK